MWTSCNPWPCFRQAIRVMGRVRRADEMEPQSDGTMFASYTARYPVPHKRSGSTSNLWYRCALIRFKAHPQLLQQAPSARLYSKSSALIAQ